jgi:Intron-binding protein aquarius N-terminus
MAPPAKKRKKGVASTSSKQNTRNIVDKSLPAPSERRHIHRPPRESSHHDGNSELLELYRSVFENPSCSVIENNSFEEFTHMQHLAQNRHRYSALLANQVWPSIVRCHAQSTTSSTTHSAPEVLDFMQLSRLAAALLSIEFFDGGVTENALNFIEDDHLYVVEAWFDSVFGSTNVSRIKSALDWTIRIHSFSIAWSCLLQRYGPPLTDGNSPHSLSDSVGKQRCLHSHMFSTLSRHIPTQILHIFMPHRYKEWYIRQQQCMLNQEKSESVPMDVESSSAEPPFIILMIQHVLHLMESDTLYVMRQGSETFARTDGIAASDIVSDFDNDNSDDEPDEENKVDGDGNYYDDGVSSGHNNDDLSFVNEALIWNDGSSAVTTTVIIPGTWQLIHRALELLCDLLSTPRVLTFCREPIIAYLHSIHWTIRCRNAIGTSEYSTAPEPMLLTQNLLERLSKLMYCFPSIRTAGGEWTHLNSEERRSIYHRRATIFQKMCHRHFPMQLPDIIYSGAGLLCQNPVVNGGATTSYLRQALDNLSEDDLNLLLHKMRLVDITDTNQDANSPGNKYDRNFLLAVLEEYLVVPIDPLDELRNYPLYPTELVLWDFTKVPPGHGSSLEYPVLSIPKLQTRYLSFADYLWRNFELMRLESAYEIRSDLTDAIRRVQPVLRHSASKSFEVSGSNVHEELKTVFSGWARMALEIQGRLEIKNVSKPLLGEIYPSQVVAEITIDLGPSGDRVRREWDELGEYDILFLVGIDAGRMSGKSAPLLHEDKTGTRQFVPDEDDRTFPERYGITIVRGCMILQVRDEAGTVLHDASSETQLTGTKRIFRVSLDSTQYLSDMKAANGTDIYNSLNLVVRRHGKVNNFKAALETIRGLMAGVGSINLVLPKWLQTAVLGYGDPKESTYQSETIKLYSKATVGVANLDSFLDFGDTFLDENHLRSSFAGLTKGIVVDKLNSADIDVSSKFSRRNYRIRVIENDSRGTKIEVESYKFREELIGNQVRFIPRQVAAIRAGLSPGLSLIVGPPGSKSSYHVFFPILSGVSIMY